MKSNTTHKVAFFAAGLILFGALCIHAQRYRFGSWTTDEGLPQNSVSSIAQTRDGYIWLVTFDGLVRFDGVKFTVYNVANSPGLPTNRLSGLFADNKDRLWITAEDGRLLLYSDRRFKVFTEADGMPPDSNVTQVQQDADGSILIATFTHLLRFRDDRISVEREQSFREFRTYIARAGNRWEINSSGLIQTAPNGRQTRYDLPFAELVTQYPDFNFRWNTRMFESPDGTLWILGPKIYELRNGTYTSYERNGEMPPGGGATAITQDRDGNIWYGTGTNGLCRLNGSGTRCFKIEDGLTANAVTSILVDSEGTVWAATPNKGINQLTRQVVSTLTAADGLVDNNIYPILEDKTGGVWIGTFNGLTHKTQSGMRNYTVDDGLPVHFVESLLEDSKDRLWFGVFGGFGFLENGKFTAFREVLGNRVKNVPDIYEDRSGTIWFATNVGLATLRNETWKLFTVEDGLPGNDVKTIIESRDGSLWIGTFDGISRYAEGRFDAYEGNGSADVQNTRTLYEDDQGILWIGTYDRGLFRLDGGKLTRYTTDSGLFSNGVFAILEDSLGYFWMSSNNGIYRVHRGELNDYADGRIARINSIAFGKSDGMLSTECNGGRQPSGIRAADGRLWFPTQEGIAIVDPAAVQHNSTPPPVVIENVAIDNQPVAFNIRGSDIEIQPNQSNLQIRYTGLSFIKPHQVRFRYRLEGLDEEWTEAGEQRVANYSYLPPGTYTFHVIAANSDNVWNEQGARLVINVLPPFYRTWWFLVISAVCLALAVFLLYRQRIAAMKRKHAQELSFSRRLVDSQEQERKRFAAEMHDGIGQSLVIIKNRARLSLKQAGNEVAIADHLENISTAASRAIEEAREIAFNLRPHLLDRLGLTKTIDSMLLTVFDAAGIRYEPEIENIDGILDQDSEILLFRIVQECANNILKHSGAAEARVAIRRAAAGFTVTVSDNGRGFDTGSVRRNITKRSFGLFGIAERTRLLGGKFEILSKPGIGTTVTIIVEPRDRQR